jgi:hypothetical protein
MNRPPPHSKRKATYVVLGLVTAGAVLACAGLGYFRWLVESGTLGKMFGYTFSSDMCGNDIYQEVYSPDRQYKVVVFERNCGATTDFSTQVSILGATQELPNISGNIFVIDGHPDYAQVQVKWESDQAMEVTYSGGREVHYQQEMFSNASQVFEIHYGVVTNE